MRAFHMNQLVLIVTMLFCLSACADYSEQEVLKRRNISQPCAESAPAQEPECEDDADTYSELVPITSLEELQQFADIDSYSTTGVLNYRFARDYAYAELRANIGLYFNEHIFNQYIVEMAYNNELLLSSRPAVVYDYEDKPYYYEFLVIFRGNIVATITVAAQPHTDEIIHYVFPSSLTYNTYDFQYRRYIGDYPNVYYGNGTGNGQYFQVKECEDGSICEEEVEGEELVSNPYDALIAKFGHIPTEDIDFMNQDLSEVAEYAVNEHDETVFGSCDAILSSLSNHDDVTGYWETMIANYGTSSECQFSPLTNEILSMIDEQLSEVENSVVGFLPEYDNHLLRLTTWSDACGPSIMSWLYRGKYDNYKGHYLPIFGQGYTSGWYYEYPTHSVYAMGGPAHDKNERAARSYSTDNGLYFTFYVETIPAGSGDALYQGGMTRGLEYATNNQYTIKFITAPIKWMEEKQQPVVVEGIRGLTHYFGAIGYGYNKTIFGTKKHMRLFVTDNGYTLSKHHYYPYWSILGGLNYGWKRN